VCSQNDNIIASAIWQYGLWSFQAGGTKLKIFLQKNNGELSKIMILVIKKTKIDFIKKCQ
jgi:hypothetical protein